MHRSASGIDAIDVKLHLEVTWLADTNGLSADKQCVDLILLDYDYLITKKKLEEDVTMEDFITPVTD